MATPFLWFDTEAEEAAHSYTGIFERSRIIAVTRYGEAGPGPAGIVMTGGDPVGQSHAEATPIAIGADPAPSDQAAS